MGTNLSRNRYLGSGNQRFSTTADFTDNKKNCDQDTRKQDICIYLNYTKGYSRNRTGGRDVGWIKLAENRNK